MIDRRLSPAVLSVLFDNSGNSCVNNSQQQTDFYRLLGGDGAIMLKLNHPTNWNGKLKSS
jgi:hypothetical protein